MWVYAGYNISQPDSLLPQRHLAVFQTNRLQGQTDLVYELYGTSLSLMLHLTMPVLILRDKRRIRGLQLQWDD